MDYEKEMKKILNNNGIDVEIVYITKSFTNWDKQNLHNQYKIILKRGTNQMQYDYWASLYSTQNGKKATIYDVISCLEWYPIYDFDNFCMDFGYDTDSIKAFNTYTECQKQQKELFELIPEEKIREQIREII
jgi:hypothetical protein